MTCTVAAIIAMLGYMPPEGTVVTVPRSQVKHYSAAQQLKARVCARRHGIKWRIDEGK